MVLPDEQPMECPFYHEAADPLVIILSSAIRTAQPIATTRFATSLCRPLTAGGIRHLWEVQAVNWDRPTDILLFGWDKGKDVCVDITDCLVCLMAPRGRLFNLGARR